MICSQMKMSSGYPRCAQAEAQHPDHAAIAQLYTFTFSHS
jgi:hypothetical protein